MGSLREIKKRIVSVKNTQQITRAMRMVAAAKLRRAQESIQALRPYAYKIRDVITHLTAVVPSEDHPLLAQREPKRVVLLVITSDRGLCGAFNANINRRTESYVAENEAGHQDIQLAIIGRKGQEYFRRRSLPVLHEYREILTHPTFENARTIADELIESFTSQSLDAVYILYNEFKSAIAQQVVVEQLLPMPLPKPEETKAHEEITEFIYEPGKQELLDGILPLNVEIQVYRAILESLASEMGARMTAMESATNNAKELIKSLTLEYNKARQAAITTELIEIISGAEAL
ncbi:MAG: ATP synthase F1 subunit gamma [Myxococcales bacterium]|nr:ATP synthase F1 subunit gamma [Myxococcales bacterium]